MDLTNNTNSTAVTATVKTPETESETPTRFQPSKPSPFSNGVLKRHRPLHHHGHHHGHPVVVVYKECLKNHAATLGGHAVDGCGEFMPAPAATPADPASLKCAACGCHRNFHRREADDPLAIVPPPAPALDYQPHHRHHPPPPPENSSSPASQSPPPISSSYYPSAPHMLMALSHGGISAPPPPPDNNNTPISANVAATALTPNSSNPSTRKRFRTRFTQDQKERMLEFAERLGWKMLKKDEDVINGFCSGIGVDKGVFKVWMHNNKNTFLKKDHLNNGNGNGNGNGVDYGGTIGSRSITLDHPITAAGGAGATASPPPYHHFQLHQDIKVNIHGHGQDLGHGHDNLNNDSSDGGGGHVLGGTNGGSSSSS